MTRTFRMLNVFTLVAVMTASVSAAGQQPAATTAQTQGPAASVPAPIQAQATDRYEVGQARPPIVEGSKLRELTLDQAYAIALEKNLDLKSARMNPQLVDYQLQGARAAFLPTFNSDYSYRNSQSPSNNALEGVANLTNTTQGYNGRWNQTLPWYGTTFSAQFTNGRSATNDITRRVNPSFSSGLSFSASMPLLAGFKIDGTRNQLRTLPVQRQIADINLVASIENTKNSVRTAYWSLRSAIEQIEINRRALEIAKKSYDDSMLKVEIGTMAPIDTTQFETALANAEQSYLASQIGWRTAELNFKRLLVTGIDDELYLMTINPTDKPSLSVQSVDIQAAVTKALAERTDIVVARRNVDINRLNLEITQGALKPNLSLSGGYSASGQGGPTKTTTGGVTSVIPGGYFDALRSASTFELPTWNIGFNFTYPLGMRSAKAAYARAVLQIDQTLVTIKAQELTISTAVINAGLNVENTYKLYQASVKSREAAEKNAAAAQVRFDNGMLTNFEVVTIQNQLTQSRLTELGRLINYVNAIAEFERVQKVGAGG
ncbi:MAG TPA: TolC family protein [Vicinamibacterales bacterium]|nr:TolC family protein [Vicinamibacterales bacterium]